jgi:uncharacterized membrane protein
MAGYKERLAKDLDRWIEAGLAPAANRDAMLATVPGARRLDAATALAWVGGLLLGVAAIAFVAANWDELPRIARFVIVLGAFALTSGIGAWAAHKGRPISSDIALMISALLFGAAIGLTGQIFDILGDPQAALYGGGIGAIALALAGRSTGAAIVALIFFGLADFTDLDLWGSDGTIVAPWLLFAAPLCVFLAMRWRSAPLAHASAVGVVFSLCWFALKFEQHAALFLLFSIALAGLAAASRWLAQQDRPHASVFYGYAAWGALLFFAIAGYADGEDANDGLEMAHRLVWLGASGALIALGRYDRHAIVTTIGVLSLMGAIAALLIDLGLDLMTAAALFFVCAIAALVGGLLLRRKPKAT